MEGVEVEFRFDFTLRERNRLLDGSIPDELLPKSRRSKSAAAPESAEQQTSRQQTGEEDEEAEEEEEETPADGEEPPEPKLPSVRPNFVQYRGAENDTKEQRSERAVVKTDAAGYARVSVELGHFVGEYRVEAQIRNQFDQRRDVTFWLFSGAELLDQDPTRREGPVGTTIYPALRVFTCDGDQVLPVEDRTVIFSTIQNRRTPGGATLERDNRKRTNNEGTAKVNLELGERSGAYFVAADLEPTADLPAFRGIVVDYYALDWLEVSFAFLGGLALFVIGLRLLSSGLLIQMGGVIDRSTQSKNPVVGFLGGTVIGATFQSSSAFISRLVIFASGGILMTPQVVGHVLGANVGKTILPQILAFGPVSSLPVPLLIAGALLFILPTQVGSRRWGSSLVGAGTLVLGWQFLERTADLAQASPTLTGMLAAWDPGSGTSFVAVFFIDAILALLLALLLQSSNLIIVAAIAFASRGLISPQMVVSLIIGANLGSALAIFVGSVTRNREARRLAFTNVLFLVFGGSWLLVATFIPVQGKPLLLLVSEWLTPGRFFHPQPENVAHHLAVLYSLFHLTNGLLLLGLSPWFLRLSDKIIPRDPVNDSVKPYHLDPNLLDVPSLAVTQATREVVYLLEIVRKSIAESFDSFRYQDLNLADQIARREASIDTVQRDISRFLLRVSQSSLSLPIASRIQCLQATASNLARIGQQGEFLRDLAAVAAEEKAEIPEDMLRDLIELYDLLMSLFDSVLHLLEAPDRRVEENAVKLGERLARSASRIENTWIERARSLEGDQVVNGLKSQVVAILCRDVYTTLAVTARHLAHIAERMRLLASD